MPLVKPKWIGLENYIGLLDDKVFAHALWVTLLLTAVLTIFMSTIPMLIAVLFNMKWGIFGTTYRTMMFMPSIISLVVIAVLWRMILDPNLGVINTLLDKIGMTTFPAELAWR